MSVRSITLRASAGVALAALMLGTPSGAAAAGCRAIVLTVDLPPDFALNQPLAHFALEALDVLDPEAPTYSLDVISVVEAVLEGAVIDPQVADGARAALEASIKPIDDVRSTADYRRDVSGRILVRVLRESGGW